MREYELTFIVNPQVEQEGLDEIVDKLKDVVEPDNGSINTVEPWGLRRLAYPIQNLREGQYVFMEISMEPAVIPELERILKLDETIIRHLIIRRDEE
ncbi:MAG: 30S ribosomal protein S6 [Anaerolineae bacterium]|jgi:small subunit ribosomal protein S6